MHTTCVRFVEAVPANNWGAPLRDVSVVRIRKTYWVYCWPMVKLRSLPFKEFVKIRAGPSCVRLPGCTQASIVSSFEAMQAVMIFEATASLETAVELFARNPPAIQAVAAGVVLIKSIGGVAPDVSKMVVPVPSSSV